MDDVDDLERPLLASEVLAFSGECALRASELVDLARQAATADAEADHPASGHLLEAADAMARAATALSAADANTRPRSAAKLVGCAARLSVAAREVDIGLADAAYNLAQESEELTRMAADLKASVQRLARQQSRCVRGWIAEFCTSRLRAFFREILR